MIIGLCLNAIRGGAAAVRLLLIVGVRFEDVLRRLTGRRCCEMRLALQRVLRIGHVTTAVKRLRFWWWLHDRRSSVRLVGCEGFTLVKSLNRFALQRLMRLPFGHITRTVLCCCDLWRLHRRRRLLHRRRNHSHSSGQNLGRSVRVILLDRLLDGIDQRLLALRCGRNARCIAHLRRRTGLQLDARQRIHGHFVHGARTLGCKWLRLMCNNGSSRQNLLHQTGRLQIEQVPLRCHVHVADLVLEHLGRLLGGVATSQQRSGRRRRRVFRIAGALVAWAGIGVRFADRWSPAAAAGVILFGKLVLAGVIHRRIEELFCRFGGRLMRLGGGRPQTIHGDALC